MRLLIAEDDCITRELLTEMAAKWGFEVVAAADGAEAWQIVQSAQAPQIALLDWAMPFLEGPAICRGIRARENAAYIYVILLTARDSRHDLVNGLDAGADDFLAKPPHPQELRARIRVGERVVRLQAELAEARFALAAAASTDVLTGLLVPQALHERLQAELARCRDRGHPISLLLVGFDGLETLRAGHGQRGYDLAQMECGRLLAEACRPYDLAGHHDPDQFLLAFPEARADDVRARAEALRRRFAEARIRLDSSEEFPLEARFGVATLAGESHPAPGECIALAEAALHEARQDGSERVASVAP